MSKIKRSTLDYSIIDGLDIEALRRIIEEDFDSPDGILDKEIWLYACEALARKEKEQGAETPDIEESLEEFKREYLPYANNNDSPVDCGEETADNVVELPKKKNLRKPFSKIMAAVIAVLVLGTVTASAMGVDVWNGIVSWTRDTFGFYDQVSDAVTFPKQLDKIKENLEANGIDPAGLLPTYIPKDYYEIDTQCQDVEDYVFFISTLTNGEDSIALQYWKYRTSEISSAHQKDDVIPEEYEIGGMAHYITSNEDKWCCIWMDGNVECSVYGVESRDELIKIINSIYKE